MGQAPPISSPPGSYDSGAKKASKATTWIVLGILAGCGCLGLTVMAAILLPVFAQARSAAIKTQSLSNIKQISTGLMIYSADYNDRLPAAEAWQDAVTPYAAGSRPASSNKGENYDIFKPPYKKNPGSYAFNKVLSRASQAELESIAGTVMVFEAAPEGRNVNGGIDIARREEKYLIVGMADSAARARPIEQIEQLVWNPKIRFQAKP